MSFKITNLLYVYLDISSQSSTIACFSFKQCRKSKNAASWLT